MDNVDFTNKKIRIQTPHSKSVLLELGLDEDKLYKISKKEYLDNHPELRAEKPEFQDKRYNTFPDNPDGKRCVSNKSTNCKNC